MRRHTLFVLLCAVSVVTLSVAPGWAIDPSERTADMPDSWLVLYNVNSADSVAWANWYQQERNIPADHMVGLNALLDEHLPDLEAVQEQIIAPVRDLLAGDADLEQSIMGIVLGYDVPGHYGTPLANPDIGGFSVSDALQDMTDDDLIPGYFYYEGGQRGYNWDCPNLSGLLLPPGGRLTKASMAQDRYMVTRIDAPTLADAMALTQRALVLEDPSYSLFGESVCYDYYDIDFPSGNHEWYWLRDATEEPELADLPWADFDSDTEPASHDAFRMSIYKLYGWSSADFDGAEPGSRVLGFHFNSFGAVTVRSTTAENALYVPNALAAGYAAAVGTTGEPFCCQSPFPGILLASLREGWTLGEAFYLANPFDDWMWTVVGDPFLHLPNWLDMPVFQGADTELLQNDVNNDGMVNQRDLAGFRACLSGPGMTSPPVCGTFDSDTDGDLDLVDFAVFQRAYTGGPVEKPTGDFDGNGKIDLADLAGLIDCQAGLEPTALESGCDVFDFDFDLDVDMANFATLQALFPGDDDTHLDDVTEFRKAPTPELPPDLWTR